VDVRLGLRDFGTMGGLGLLSLLLLVPSVHALTDVFSAGLTIGDFVYFCIKIPSILLTESGSLIAFGEGRVGSCADVAETHLISRRSFDNGETWDNATIVYSDPGNVVGNAVPVQANNGNVVLPFTVNNRETWLTSSADNGFTWTTPAVIPDSQEHDWVWVGLGPPGGLRLKSGKLLIPGYHGHVPMSNGSSLGSAFTKGHILLSDDDGETWSLVNTDFGEPYFVNELQAAEMSDGSIIINARMIDDHRVLAKSTDGGFTFPLVWRPEELHETFQGCEGSMISDDSQSRLMYSGVQGRLPLRIYRENLTLFDSYDQGATWTFNSIIDVGSTAYSAMAWFAEKQQGGILYERADCTHDDCPLVFIPDHISWKMLD
jgi:sialidase-1